MTPSELILNHIDMYWAFKEIKHNKAAESCIPIILHLISESGQEPPKDIYEYIKANTANAIEWRKQQDELIAREKAEKARQRAELINEAHQKYVTMMEISKMCNLVTKEYEKAKAKALASGITITEIWKGV